jgi:hypothetical protein
MSITQPEDIKSCFLHFIYQIPLEGQNASAPKMPPCRPVGMAGVYWPNQREFRAFWGTQGLALLKDELAKADAVFGWNLDRVMLPSLALTLPDWDLVGLRLVDMQAALFRSTGKIIEVGQVGAFTFDEEPLSEDDETLLFHAGRIATCQRLCRAGGNRLSCIYDHGCDPGFLYFAPSPNGGCPEYAPVDWGKMPILGWPRPE